MQKYEDNNQSNDQAAHELQRQLDELKAQLLNSRLKIASQLFNIFSTKKQEPSRIGRIFDFIENTCELVISIYAHKNIKEEKDYVDNKAKKLLIPEYDVKESMKRWIDERTSEIQSSTPHRKPEIQY